MVLVLGMSSILAISLSLFFSSVPAIAALVLARSAKREISQSQGALGGEKLVLGGQICAIIGLALTVFVGIFIAAFYSSNY
jgi:ABC-type phosphate transport system permease subunit